MSFRPAWLVRAVATSALVAGALAIPSAAMTGAAGASMTTHVCSGSPSSPGVLAGTYHANVRVEGACAVNAGRAVVDGNVIVTAHSVLLAAYALNDRTHSGSSSLTVRENVTLRKGSAMILGCEALHFPCIDDHSKTPTLQARETIDGSLFVRDALGVLVHNSSIYGSVVQRNGGGGLTCKPKGIFAAFKSPVFTDYEDNVIGDSMSVTGVHSCWFGALRNAIHGSGTFSDNEMADPDANEVVSNVVNRSLTCQDNSPKIQFGDSEAPPNVVNGMASGECRFNRLVPDPAPNGTPEPISVRASQ